MNKNKFTKIIAGTAITGCFLLSVFQPVAAQTPTSDMNTPTPAATGTLAALSTETTTASYSANGGSLCLPYLSGTQSLNCAMAGPADQLTELAKEGITFPSEPLTIVHPSADLASVPYTYAKVVPDAIPMYDSVEDAAAKNINSMMPAGKFKYVSLEDKETGPDGLLYYRIDNGKWINSQYITKVSIVYLQGYLVKKLPSVVFGWVLQSQIPSYTKPSYLAPKTGKIYNRLQTVSCYGTQEAEGAEWIEIGPNEWMDHKYIARVINNPVPPKGVTNGRWIEVNLEEQVMNVYENSKLIFTTVISSGQPPFYTRPGIFQIYRKVDFEYMTGAFEADRSDYYYIEQVPYIMYFDSSRALHGAYWNTYLGYAGSHGCVNLSVADAHWLYEWAKQGDYVYVWDPSGKTPTDSALYSQGAF